VPRASSRVGADAPYPEIALLAARPWSGVERVGPGSLEAAIDAAGPAVRDHPAVLLHLARSLEPGLRHVRRSQALDRLDAVLRADRHRAVLRLESMAERAIDEARNARLDAAEILARRVIDDVDALGDTGTAPARHPARGDPFVARARAGEALGRVLAWRGDRHAAALAARHLDEAAAAYRRLGSTEWEGGIRVWAGNSVHYQWGDLSGAEGAMRAGFAVLAPDSPRRAVLLTFLAEVLLTRGRLDEMDSTLGEAAALAAGGDDPAAISYVAWVRARASSLAGDASATVRWLVEVEHHSSDWWDMTTGPTFLADAAEILDRVGDRAGAEAYLARATARAPDDEFVAQAAAVLAARRGDPVDGLVRLRRLAHAPWLEKRLTWRRSLFEAYALLRARRPDAGALAARAFAEAAEQGGPGIASGNEPEMAAALAPLAEAEGSLVARAFLAPVGGIVVRLLGDVRVSGPDGDVALPSGAGGALVRLLALHPGGLDHDEIIDRLWPEADTHSGRRRLRDTVFRVRARAGDLVERDGDRLRLHRCWVDATAFRRAADRALAEGAGTGRAGSGGDRRADADGPGPGNVGAAGTDAAARATLIATALALWSGDPLPGDLYADWSTAPRAQLRRRHDALLAAAADDAVVHGRYFEAVALLEEAAEADPDGEHHYLRLAELHHGAGRTAAAVAALRRAAAVTDRLGLPASAAVRAHLAHLGGDTTGG
jgi:DNA-binding SARP family transcriptional activator